MLDRSRDTLSLKLALPRLLLALGFLLRLHQFAANRSLWADETTLSLNILHRSFLQLLAPLDYAQSAPVLFLWLQKLAITLLGAHDLIFRLVPFSAATLSLILFYRWAKSTLSPWGASIALAVFALYPFLIYYASEAKQYSCDVLVITLFLPATQWLLAPRLTARTLITLTLLGLVSIFLSQIAPFILVPVAFLAILIAHARSRLGPVLIMTVLWFAAIALNYHYFLRPAMNDTSITWGWQLAYLPFPPHTAADISRWLWFPLTILESHADSGFNRFSALALALAAVGLLNLFRRDWPQALLLSLTLALAVAAFFLRLYPLVYRLSLFLVPLLAALLGAAFDFPSFSAQGKFRNPIASGDKGNSAIPATLAPPSALSCDATRVSVLETSLLPPIENRKWKIKTLLRPAPLLALILLAPLILRSAYRLIIPARGEDLRSVLNFVQNHYHPSDTLIIYPAAQGTFTYYTDRSHAFSFPKANIVFPTSADPPSDPVALALDPPGLPSPLPDPSSPYRIWIIFSHIVNPPEADTDDQFLHAFLTHGKLLTQTHASLASAYLIEISP